ncbi:MAG: S8 family serine peptidase [bacterium]
MKKNSTNIFYYSLYVIFFLALPCNICLVEGDGVRNAQLAFANSLIEPTQINLMVPLTGNIPNTIGLNNQGILSSILGARITVPVDPIISNNPLPPVNALGQTGARAITPAINAITNPPALPPAMNTPVLENRGAVTSPINAHGSLFAPSPIPALMQIGIPAIFPTQGIGMQSYNPGIGSLMTGSITPLVGFMGNNPINSVMMPTIGSYPFSNTHGVSMPYTQNVPFTISNNSPSPIASLHIMNSPNANPLVIPPPVNRQPAEQVNTISTLEAPFEPPPPVNIKENSRLNPLSHSVHSEEFTVGTSAFSSALNFNGQSHTNEVIVIFLPGTSGAVIDEIHKKCGAQMVKVSPYAGFHLAPVPAGTPIEEFIQRYTREPFVLYAEPNYIRHAHLLPNDPLYIYQWHLPALSAGWAWDIGTGFGAVVALLDSGVAYRTSGIYAQAPDLAGASFAPGYDFVNLDAFPDDDNSHGTFMCGCIAQTTNNALGVAGVAFNATIMPVKIMDADGYVTVANEVEGIYFAVNNGAHIINLSLGGVGVVVTEQTAVDYAYNSGVVVISSAGNKASSTLEYPASYDTCISVSATQYDDTLAPYSNYGTAIDVCAPGGNLNLDQNFDGRPDGILQQSHDGLDFTLFSYTFIEGTSPACALVSGVATLVIGNSAVALTPLQVKGILESSAFDLGAVGWDEYYGAGKVNAWNALLNTP